MAKTIPLRLPLETLPLPLETLPGTLPLPLETLPETLPLLAKTARTALLPLEVAYFLRTAKPATVGPKMTSNVRNATEDTSLILPSNAPIVPLVIQTTTYRGHARVTQTQFAHFATLMLAILVK